MQGATQDVAGQDVSSSPVDDHGIAKLLGVSVSLVRKDRYTTRHIPYTRFRGVILYFPERVLEALRALEEGGVQKHARARAEATAEWRAAKRASKQAGAAATIASSA